MQNTICPICKEEFRTSQGRAGHIQLVHGKLSAKRKDKQAKQLEQYMAEPEENSTYDDDIVMKLNERLQQTEDKIKKLSSDVSLLQTRVLILKVEQISAGFKNSR